MASTKKFSGARTVPTGGLRHWSGPTVNWKVARAPGIDGSAHDDRTVGAVTVWVSLYVTLPPLHITVHDICTG